MKLKVPGRNGLSGVWSANRLILTHESRTPLGEQEKNGKGDRFLWVSDVTAYATSLYLAHCRVDD
jgi:hypothetical protein